jgi:hypothetical protein
VLLAISWGLPTMFAFALGQDIALMLLIVAATARLWDAKRPFAAGVVASLLALKATLLLPVAIVFLMRSRHGLGGLALGCGIQFAISWAVQGPEWIPQYLAAVRSPLLDQAPERMPAVRALVSGAPFVAVAAAIYVWLAYLARRESSAARALTCAIPLGIVASPHCYAYDMVAAAPLLAGAADPRSARGLFALLALSPLPYWLISIPHRLGAAILAAAVLVATFHRDIIGTNRKGDL